MGRHAYLILAHKNFNQLKTLISLLDDPRNDIFVHVDLKASDFKEEEFKFLCKNSRLIFVEERYKVNWGGVSIMRAELSLLKKATQTGRYDYYHLLSGMDLPIKSQSEIHSFFDENAGKEFIKFWEFKKSTYSRFRYFTIFPEGEGKFKTRIINHIFKGLQMAVGFRINRKIDFKFASQWFSITDSLARYVVARRDWLEKVFKHTSTCDEIFLPTLVYDSDFKNNLYVSEPVKSQKEVNRADMRLIDWTRGESIRHPWVFTKGDYKFLTDSDLLWARKFDENVDSEIIGMIAEKVKE
ncbi:MAG: glycosyl transferase [Muribaculaceae bacterium]|nr:glycosyl transferase [Muribaculaceae bacterium]